MRLGISSYTYSWAIGVHGDEPVEKLDPWGLLEKAGQHGVSCLQIADNLPLHILTGEQFDTLYQASHEKGISIEVGTRGLIPENLETYLAIAGKMKSALLRVVIDAEGFTPDQNKIISILRECEPEFGKREIKLAIENHDRFKARDFRNFIEAAASEWIGICLDTANSLGAGEGIDEVINILGPVTINFHIKDIMIRRIWHKMGFEIEGMPAGKGMIPIAGLFDKLTKWGEM